MQMCGNIPNFTPIYQILSQLQKTLGLYFKLFIYWHKNEFYTEIHVKNKYFELKLGFVIH